MKTIDNNDDASDDRCEEENADRGVFLILLSWILIMFLIGMLIGIPILLIVGLMVFVSIFMRDQNGVDAC